MSPGLLRLLELGRSASEVGVEGVRRVVAHEIN